MVEDFLTEDLCAKLIKYAGPLVKSNKNLSSTLYGAPASYVEGRARINAEAIRGGRVDAAGAVASTPRGPSRRRRGGRRVDAAK